MYRSGNALAGRLVFAFLMFCAPAVVSAARAEGTFISAPDRIDVAYDDARSLLYISNGTQVLRYQLGTASFLSPITLGGALKGLDVSSDGTTLAVADDSHDATNNWIYLVNLNTLSDTKVKFPLDFGEGGTFTAAYGRDGALLVTSNYEGSGPVPLRRYDPATGKTTDLGYVNQQTMLRTSANGKVIALAESNSSGGPFDKFVVRGQTLTHGATGWYNFEIGVAPIGEHLRHSDPVRNRHREQESSSHREGDRSEGWLRTQRRSVRSREEFSSIFRGAELRRSRFTAQRPGKKSNSFDFVDEFSMPRYFAFIDGRAKTSKDGSLLFVTVNGGVRYVSTRHHHHG